VRKLTYEFVKSKIEECGHKLLSDSYEGSHSKLKCLCSNKHKYQIAWSEWKKGQRCAKCVHDNLRMSIQFIKSQFEKENYKLLTTEYKNNMQKLEYICPKGHKYSIAWDCWKSGHRCAVCAGNIRHTIEFIRSKFEEEGYTLITDKYTNQKQKLDYICSNSHKNSIVWSDWYNQGCRCSTCWSISIIGEGNHRWKNGISYEPYCSIWKDKEYKEDIKARDNYECQNSDCWGKKGEAAIIMPHHIDYDKKNCSPSNLITLCRSCNSRANANRKYWQKLYEQNIKRRSYYG